MSRDSGEQARGSLLGRRGCFKHKEDCTMNHGGVMYTTREA